MLQHIMDELNLGLLDCAAALLHLQQLEGGMRMMPEKNVLDSSISGTVSVMPKMVRYRLAVGNKHGVSKEVIKDVLVDESGVERKMIRLVDIRNEFTIVELPEGMPEDIFQHLKTIEVQRQKLDIKRLSANSNKKRASNARRRKKRMSRLESKDPKNLNCKEIA
ncbi:DbpA RNA binding domain-containing protein [Methylotuvimicrobium alcaliphilum]|nr:DbpA RNA binding domain-containing protein [Methylotuvimicrobium alcaliphilum]